MQERATASTHAPPSLFGVDPESRPSGCSARSQAAQRSVRMFSATIRIEGPRSSSRSEAQTCRRGQALPRSARWRSLVGRPGPSKHSLLRCPFLPVPYHSSYLTATLVTEDLPLARAVLRIPDPHRFTPTLLASLRSVPDRRLVSLHECTLSTSQEKGQLSLDKLPSSR